MPRPSPARFKVEVPKELLDALPAAAELYVLLWPGDPPQLVITVMPEPVARFVPTNYREIPCRLLLGPPHKPGGHWRRSPR